MRLLEKIASTEGLLQLMDRLVRWGLPLIGTSLSGLLAGWATSATDVLQAYSPASWVFGSFVGACLFLFAWYTWAAARIKVLRYAFAKDFATRPQQVNPLDNTFTKTRIDITAFHTPTLDVVERKVFVDCELRGPAVVFFTGNSDLSHATFIECDLVKVKDTAELHNGIQFKDLTVRGGRLYNLIILIPESQAANFPYKNAPWITG